MGEVGGRKEDRVDNGEGRAPSRPLGLKSQYAGPQSTRGSLGRHEVSPGKQGALSGGTLE